MNIVSLFEQLARTPHHKINLEELLKKSYPELQQVFINNDAVSLKALFNENNMLADRSTVFEF